MNNGKFIGSPIAWAMAMVAGIGLLAAADGPALAQAAGYNSGDPAVTVDMSVLDGGSSVSAPTSPATALPPAAGFRGRLMVPGPETPVSRLYVKPRKSPAPSRTPGKESVAATSAKGPAMPPAKAPASKSEGPAVMAPPAPKVAAPVTPRPEPATPAPTVEAPAPAENLASAPPPPVVEKPQTPTAAPTPPAAAVAPPPPAIEKPQAAITPPNVPGTPVAPPPAAAPKPQTPAPQVALPQTPAPQAPSTVVPAPPPPPPADSRPVSSAPPTPPAAGEQAAVPKSEKPSRPGDALKILFDTEEAKLTDQARDELKAVLQGILDDGNLRVQLLAYAGGESLSSSKARRLSLSRALAVRSYLIENGLRSTRIDVRALGDKTTDQPVNRVDVNIVER